MRRGLVFILLFQALACKTFSSKDRDSSTPQTKNAPQDDEEKRVAEEACYAANQVFDPTTGICVDQETYCRGLKDGSVWDSKEKTCLTAKALCLEAAKIWDGKTCMTLQEQCTTNKGVWQNDKCLTKVEACTSADFANKWIAEANGLGTCTHKSFMDYCQDVNLPKEYHYTILFLHLAAGSSDLSCSKTLAKLQATTELRLDGNEILRNLDQQGGAVDQEAILTELAPIMEFVHFETLILPNNKISNLKRLSPLTKLRLLDLQGNEVRTLDGLETLTSLNKLFLGYNKLTSIDGVQKMPYLTDLHIFDNAIASLKPLEHATRLHKLYAKSNFINSLVDLAQATQLEVLNVTFNPISEAGFEKLESNCPTLQGAAVLKEFCREN